MLFASSRFYGLKRKNLQETNNYKMKKITFGIFICAALLISCSKGGPWAQGPYDPMLTNKYIDSTRAVFIQFMESNGIKQPWADTTYFSWALAKVSLDGIPIKITSTKTRPLGIQYTTRPELLYCGEPLHPSFAQISKDENGVRFFTIGKNRGTYAVVNLTVRKNSKIFIWEKCPMIIYTSDPFSASYDWGEKDPKTIEIVLKSSL